MPRTKQEVFDDAPDAAATTAYSVDQVDQNSQTEAVTLESALQCTYGDRRPPHRIYIELFDQRQGEQKTDIFISKCRALLAQIPAGDISMSAQLDMVYGLLDRRVQKRLRREEFKTFDELLHSARTIDEAYCEAADMKGSIAIPVYCGVGAAAVAPLPPALRRSTTSTSPSTPQMLFLVSKIRTPSSPSPGGLAAGLRRIASASDQSSSSPSVSQLKLGHGYPCRECGRRFNQSGHLAIHMRMHTGERPYPCDLCPKAFKVKVERDDHRRTHTGERPFACAACPKTFTAAARLREHARIHTDQRPYRCEICGAAFRRPYARTVHTLIHTGEKPHECDICGTAFRRSGDMWKHKRTLHGVQGVIKPDMKKTCD